MDHRHRSPTLPSGSRTRARRHRADRGPGPVRRRRALRRRPAVRQPSRFGHGPAGPARPDRQRRPLSRLPRLPITTAAPASSSGSTPPGRCTTEPSTTMTGTATPGMACGKASVARDSLGWTAELGSRTPSFDSNGRRRTGGASISSGRSPGATSATTWSARPATAAVSSRDSLTWSASRSSRPPPGSRSCPTSPPGPST